MLGGRRTPEVLAVVVLYGLRAEQSAAFRSMSRVLELVGARHRVELMLHDNSPGLQPAPPGYADSYTRDATNPGLARAYNGALAAAERKGAAWLLLLDQDTEVTPAYMAEVLETTQLLRPRREVCALVPKLMQGERMLSPHRAPYVAAGAEVSREFAGETEDPGRVFNSGSVLRCEALRAIGGFPERFALDYLDHATFFLLRATGCRVVVLRAELEHALAQEQAGGRGVLPLPRLGSMLRGAALYFQQYGTEEERRGFRRDLERRAVAALLRGRWQECGILLRTRFLRGK